jgi:hypothetical protein
MTEAKCEATCDDDETCTAIEFLDSALECLHWYGEVEGDGIDEDDENFICKTKPVDMCSNY